MTYRQLRLSSLGNLGEKSAAMERCKAAVSDANLTYGPGRVAFATSRSYAVIETDKVCGLPCMYVVY